MQFVLETHKCHFGYTDLNFFINDDVPPVDLNDNFEHFHTIHSAHKARSPSLLWKISLENAKKEAMIRKEKNSVSVSRFAT